MRMTDLASVALNWQARMLAAWRWIEAIGSTIGHRAPAAAAALISALALAGCSGESPDALMASAKDHLAKNERAEAVIQLKDVLQQTPDSAEARFLLGKVLLESGDAAGAAVELRRARSLGF